MKAAQLPQPTHVEYQQQVIDLVHLYGWQHLHVRRSIGRQKMWTTTTNRKGWPDLLCWHPRHGFLAIEIKVGKDKPTLEQAGVLEELKAAGASCWVLYPRDLDLLHHWLKDPT